MNTSDGGETRDLTVLLNATHNSNGCGFFIAEIGEIYFP